MHKIRAHRPRLVAYTHSTVFMLLRYVEQPDSTVNLMYYKF